MAGTYQADTVYAPVTVTGTLSSSHGQGELYLVDGSALIDRAYQLDAELVVEATDE